MVKTVKSLIQCSIGLKPFEEKFSKSTPFTQVKVNNTKWRKYF